MTPIEKNIIVVDEHGNKYEATYPKRAKGLVKNGRARFIDEYTLCLACPPDKSEDIHMTENNSTKQIADFSTLEATADNIAPLTAREIFEKIASLQKQLTESSYHSLHRLDDSVSAICSDENEEKCDQISEVCSVFKMRETTFIKMLELYERMYNDLTLSEKNKVDIIKAAFSEQLEFINKSELKNEDRYVAISEITNKISELIENLLVPATPERVKQKIIDQMTWTISSTGASNESKAYASEVLKEYLSGN